MAIWKNRTSSKTKNLGGVIKQLKVDLRKIFASTELVDKVAAMMQKTVLMDSESIIQRVISGLIQKDLFLDI